MPTKPLIRLTVSSNTCANTIWRGSLAGLAIQMRISISVELKPNLIRSSLMRNSGTKIGVSTANQLNTTNPYIKRNFRIKPNSGIINLMGISNNFVTPISFWARTKYTKDANLKWTILSQLSLTSDCIYFWSSNVASLARRRVSCAPSKVTVYRQAS